MKNKLTLTLLVAALLGMVACQKVDEAAAAAKAKMDEQETWTKKAQAAVQANIAASNSGKAEEIGKLYAEDAVSTSANMPEAAAVKGRKAIQEQYAGYMKAFPDMKYENKRTTISGDIVVMEGVVSGTNTGPMMGPDGKEMKPTKKAFKVQMATVYKLNKDGLIVEETTYWDNMAFMQQLGLAK